MNVIFSPLTKNYNVTKLKTIQRERIIELYKNNLNINVEYLLSESSEIELYQCNDSGYRFYYPFNIAGDSSFYEQLQKFPWYYMPWKWEHEVTASLIKHNNKVLEIGCAQGDFLEKINKEKKIKAVGLELNEDAVKISKEKSLEVYSELIEHHAINQQNQYDVVCAFQVLEHIADVKSFIESSILCLKSGGKLVIGVPNNDSFLGLDEFNILNLPPHHMGLWNKKSFKALEGIFNIKLKRVFYEPQQVYHQEYYNQVIDNYFSKSKLNKIIRNKNLLKIIILGILRIRKKTLKSFTILVEFEKK